MPVSIGVQWPSAETAKSCNRADLQLVFCSVCGFIWNRTFEPSQLEYSQRYDNSLDYSPVFRQYADSVARRLIDTYSIRRKHVIEIGCGKGNFLNLLCELGDNHGLGFDPSYERSRNQSVGRTRYIQDLYGPKYIDLRADLICCRHVFEHIQKPVEFLSLVREAIGDGGTTVVYFEVPNVRSVLEKLSMWDIIYEHCNYFSQESLRLIFERSGFEVVRWEECYGEQFVSLEAVINEAADEWSAPQEMSRLEATVASFADRVRTRTESWLALLERWRKEQARVVLWGAGAKSVTFLNLLGITDAIPYVVDINPHKQGQYLPGTGQKIVAPGFLKEFRPNKVVLMNPIYRHEIESQLAEVGIRAEFCLA